MHCTAPRCCGHARLSSRYLDAREKGPAARRCRWRRPEAAHPPVTRSCAGRVAEVAGGMHAATIWGAARWEAGSNKTRPRGVRPAAGGARAAPTRTDSTKGTTTCSLLARSWLQAGGRAGVEKKTRERTGGWERVCRGGGGGHVREKLLRSRHGQSACRSARAEGAAPLCSSRHGRRCCGVARQRGLNHPRGLGGPALARRRPRPCPAATRARGRWRGAAQRRSRRATMTIAQYVAMWVTIQ
jgi:hypothetical protein